jgi:hypothetical protein
MSYSDFRSEFSSLMEEIAQTGHDLSDLAFELEKIRETGNPLKHILTDFADLNRSSLSQEHYDRCISLSQEVKPLFEGGATPNELHEIIDGDLGREIMKFISSR